MNMHRPQEEIDWHFNRFVGLIQKTQDDEDRLSVRDERKQVRTEKGRVYWKIMIESHDEWGGSRERIFGFVRREDGAIFRAADMKAPETRTKNPIRGYIWEEDAGNTFSWTGINYDMGT